MSEILLKFWQAEQDTPEWYRASTELWRTTKDEFLALCEKSEIYIIGECLVFVEPSGELHFSVLKGAKIDVEPFWELREQLFTRYSFLFGWVLSKNRGVRKLCESAGLRFTGLKMFYGGFRGRLLEWHCYGIKKQKDIVFPYEKMLSLPLT